MKLAALFMVAALAVVAVGLPAPSDRVPDPFEAPRPAAFAVCPAGDGARRTSTVAVIGSAEADADMSVFSAGESVAATDLRLPDSGALTATVNELTAVAQAPVLVALPDARTSAELVLSSVGEAAMTCDAGVGDVVVLPGGSTNGEDSFTVVLANPFAGSALVDVGAASEVGTESNAALEGIVVPPRSAVSVDLGAILPGRLGMSAWVTPIEGRIVASALQEGPGDLGAVQGLVPGLDWYLPVAELSGISTDLVIANPSNADVAFQLDVYGPDELIEASYEDVVPSRGHLSIPVSDLLEGAGSVRVVAAGRVAAALRLVGEVGRAIVPGAPVASAEWQLPGAGLLGVSQIVMLNPGDFDVTAEVIDPSSGNETLSLEIGAGKTAVIPMEATAVGATVRADGDIVVTWLTRTANGISGDAGRVPPP